MSLTSLEKARIVNQERIASGIPVIRLNPLEKLKNNPLSLRCAINAKCYDCIGQDADPDWRGNIRNCVCTDCPLYAVRPYRQTLQT